MKKIILLLTCCIIMGGCGTTVYQLTSPCTKLSDEDLYRSIATLMMQNDFTLQHSDPVLGFSRYTSVNNSFGAQVSGYDVAYYWTFQKGAEGIIATCTSEIGTHTIYGVSTSTYYYNVTQILQS